MWSFCVFSAFHFFLLGHVRRFFICRQACFLFFLFGNFPSLSGILACFSAKTALLFKYLRLLVCLRNPPQCRSALSYSEEACSSSLKGIFSLFLAPYLSRYTDENLVFLDGLISYWSSSLLQLSFQSFFHPLVFDISPGFGYAIVLTFLIFESLPASVKCPCIFICSSASLYPSFWDPTFFLESLKRGFFFEFCLHPLFSRYRTGAFSRDKRFSSTFYVSPIKLSWDTAFSFPCHFPIL